MSKQEIRKIINQLAANPATARKLSAQMIVARRRNLDPVLIVGEHRIHLTTGGNKRGTLPVTYQAFR